MNTLFFTDKPLGTLSIDLMDEIRESGLANAVIPFSMGDSYNAAPIVGTEAALLEGKKLKSGVMFEQTGEAVVGWSVAQTYHLNLGD